MQLDATKITQSLREHLENLDYKPSRVGVGTIVTLGDGVAQVSRLDDVKWVKWWNFRGNLWHGH